MKHGYVGAGFVVATLAVLGACQDSGTPAGMTAGMVATAGAAAPAGSSAVTAGMNAAAGASAAAGMTASAAGSGTAAGATAAAGSGGAPAAGSAGAAGCGSESFAAIYQSIFADKMNNCTGALCHGRDASGLAMVGNLNLSNAQVAYTQLVGKASDGMMCAGKTRVVPGDPKNSLLVQKLRGDTTMCGAPMPVASDEISEEALMRITNWIACGALNN